MLDTIIVGLLVLSALFYGFWQYFAPKADDRDRSDRKRSKKNFRIKKKKKFIHNCLFLADTWCHPALSDAFKLRTT